MQIEETPQKKIFIPLLTSKSKIDEHLDSRYVLAESILHNNSERATSNLEFKISNFHEILKNPASCPSNLVINEPFKIVTQLESLTETEVKLIIDVTVKEKQNVQNLKKMELEGKTRIGVCYLPKFENVSKNDKEIKLILSPRRILKKIEHEAFDGDLCFTGIGVLKISDLLDVESFENMMFQGIKDFVKKHGSPVIIDLEGRNKDQEVSDWLFGNIEESLRKKIFLVNFKFEFKKQSEFFEGAAKEITQIDDFSNLKFFLENGFKVQVKLFSFVRKGFVIENIGKIVQEILKGNEGEDFSFVDNVILTPGIEFKTDLLEYGGPGYKIINQIYDVIEVENFVKEKIFKKKFA